MVLTASASIVPKEVVPTLSKSAATSAVLLAGLDETMLKVKSTAVAVAAEEVKL